MSRDVSKLDKAVRIIGFSLYISFIVFFFFLFFRGLEFSLQMFLISTVYFVIILFLLTITKHIHFNVLLRRKQIKKSLFDSHYPLARFKPFLALSWVVIALLAIMAVIYFYYSMPVHATALIIIGAMSYAYFHIHRIGVHIMKEGIAFDYGNFIVLFQWSEIKRIHIKGNHVILDLKEKYIRRRFYIDEPQKFKKVASKFMKITS